MGRIWGLLFASSKEPAYAVLEFRPKWMIFRPLTRRTFSLLLRYITPLSFYPFLLSLFLSSFFSLFFSPSSSSYSLSKLPLFLFLVFSYSPPPLPSVFLDSLYSSSAFSPFVLLIFLLTLTPLLLLLYISFFPLPSLFLGFLYSSSFSLPPLPSLFLSLLYFSFSFSLSLVFRR